MIEDLKTKQYPLANESKGIFFASVIVMSPRWGFDDCTPSEAEGWGYCDVAPMGLSLYSPRMRGARRAGWDSFIILMSPSWGWDNCTPSEAEG
jgi:hypothetical protein